MKRSFASGRAGFTPADLTFVESVAGDERHRQALRRLCQDPEALREILDGKEVLRALLERPVALPVSASLYFYVLVRHAFLDGGIDDVELADYVAGVLVEKLACRADPRPGAMADWVTHAVDFLSVISATSGVLRFHLEIAAGDQFLLLTGIFPGFIRNRAERNGAPGLDFYESFARQAYRRAAGHREAPAEAPRHVFDLLSEVFPQARRSLNRMCDHYCF